MPVVSTNTRPWYPRRISVPGAELVLRVANGSRTRATRVISKSGRNRSIIGTHSLLNAASPPVAALRNGTIGWTLAVSNWNTPDADASVRAPRTLARPPPSAPVRRRPRRRNASTCRVSPMAGRARPPPPTCHDLRTPEDTEAGHCLAPLTPEACWFRKPTMSPAWRRAPGYWWTTMAYGNMRPPGWPRWLAGRGTGRTLRPIQQRAPERDAPRNPATPSTRIHPRRLDGRNGTRVLDFTPARTAKRPSPRRWVLPAC